MNAARGLTTVSASLLALIMAATPVVESSRTDIDKFLGTQSSKIVTDSVSDGESLYTYTSDYADTTELVDAIEDLGERMSEEGSVLLKNNGALPLTADETKKVSLLGYSSYFPTQGGDMGSSLTENVGTDADTVDFVTALEAKGFGLNDTLKTVYTGLKEEIKSETVLPWGTFQTYHQTAPSVDGLYKSVEPTTDRLTQEDEAWQDSMNDYNTMIVTIARSGTENGNYTPGTAGVDESDALNQTDPLGLNDTERALIDTAIQSKKQNGGKVIILLNNSSAMEIEELKDNVEIDAIMQIGLPGGYGFYGIADLLSGESNPSGHLTDTYAVVNANSPAAQNYGDYEYTNANPDYSINSEIVEAEGIYTGYKYYETRYADTVLGQGNAGGSVGSSTESAWNYDDEVSYTFGYGLSYTTFEQKLESVDVDLENKTVTANVAVTNTGDVAGKDAVQFYVSTPYTDYDIAHRVEKSAVQLLDYEKTELLEPGQSQTITIEADAQYMASWDSTYANANGSNGTYILDAGIYYFSVGNGTHEAINNILAKQDAAVAEGDAANVATYELGEIDGTTFSTTKNGTQVENQLADMDLNYYMPDTVTYLSRSDWEGTWPTTYQNLTATDEMLNIMQNGTYQIEAKGDTSEVVFGADNGMNLAEMKNVTDFEDSRWNDLIDQITLEESMIRTGFGGTSTKTIESIVSPEAIQNDGPNGFNSYTLGQYANTDQNSEDPYTMGEDDANYNYKAGVMGNATVVAQTFNKELANEFGVEMGNYSIWSNCTIFWGAATNIHRLPYNARNHEYYSEDPILSAYQGAAFVEGGIKYGCILATKHFAFNDTEINRTGLSTFMTEQKARECELRGTQSVVEDAGTLGVMTAYNRVGVTPDNAHEGLLVNILRGEWGFKGLMSEDFIQDPFYASLKDAVHCGVTMTCNTGDNKIEAVSAKWSYWTTENVGQDAELMQNLKTAMKYQNYALANSNAMDGLASSSRIEAVATWYDQLIMALKVVFGMMTIASAAFLVITLRKKEDAKKEAE